MKLLNLNNNIHKKRLIGIILIFISTPLFFFLNRFQKLGTIKEELFTAAARKGECFQGFCVGGDPDATLISRWLNFSFEYLELVFLGMVFAFVIAGIVESFIFPRKENTKFFTPGFKGIIRGYLIAPTLNLCSACIVPIVNSLKNKGSSLESVIALAQGSSTLNFLSIIMIFTIFSSDLGWNRIIAGAVSVFLFGPIISRLTYGLNQKNEIGNNISPISINKNDSITQSLREGFKDFLEITKSNVIKLGPIMIVAGFAAGLIIQFLSAETINNYLGNNFKGVIIASTIGVLINVPLLFEIPLVVTLLLLGMGVAPASSLLFTAASGGPITFWGLGKVLPKRSVFYYASLIWILGILTGTLSIFMSDNMSLGIKLTDNEPIIKQSDFNNNSANNLNENDPDFLSDNKSIKSINAEFNPFEKLTYESFIGVTEVWNYRPGVVIFDFDRDNDMDFLITNGTEFSNLLYQNNGNNTFTDISINAGLDDKQFNASGAVACDINNDGYQDLYIGGKGFNGDGLDFRSLQNEDQFIGIEDRLYLNLKNGKFKDITKSAFGTNLNYRSASSVICSDIDNDGFLDIYVTNLIDEDFFMSSLFWPSHPGHYNLLYKNNGDETFEEIAKQSGVQGPEVIMLTPEGKGIYFSDPTGKEYMGFNPLVKDKDSNTVGDPTGPSHAAIFFDYDDDGDQDLWVASDGDQLHIFRNESSKEKIFFQHVSEELGLNIIGNWMGFSVSDFNNDLIEDIFVTNAGPHQRIEKSGINSPSIKPGGDCKYHELHELGTCLHLFLINQRSSDSFKDKTEKINIVPSPYLPAEATIKKIKENAKIPKGLGAYDFGYGVTAFDFNNDTIKDIYWLGSEVGRGEGPGGNIYPSAGRMLMGLPNLEYEDITVRAQVLDIQGINYKKYFSNLKPNEIPDEKYNLKYKVHTKYHENGKGLAHGDLNGDGYVDLIGTNSSGPVWSGTLDDAPGPFFVWINGGGNNNWIDIKLTGRQSVDGTGSNADGIGAKVYIETKDSSNNKSIQMQEVRAGSSYLSMNSINLEFGLGDIEMIDKITVIWPSGITQILQNINSNQKINIIELNN